MSPVVIVVVVLVVLVVLAALLLNPVLRRRGQEAVDAAQGELGGRELVRLVDRQAVGFGSTPDEVGGLRGQGVLAVSDLALVFVTWAPRKTFRVDRSAITGVTTSAPDARTLDKASIEVAFTDAAGAEATASWRVAEVARWLDVLGYDWGPEGPPDLDATD